MVLITNFQHIEIRFNMFFFSIDIITVVGDTDVIEIFVDSFIN